MEIWQNTPFAIIIFYAGLQAVPIEQLEATSIDGAGAIRQFFSVKIPHLKHLLILVFTMRFMDSFRIYDRIAVMTEEAGNATESVSLYTYTMAFTKLRLGEGSAAGVLILIMLAIPVFLLLKLMKTRRLTEYV